MTARATDTGRGVIERFNSVQVYVHALLAISIFLLWLTGLPMTFYEPLGWLIDLFGHSNVVLIHVVAGVGLIAVMIYYAVYMALGLTTGNTTLRHVMFGLDDVREVLQQLQWLAGLGAEPESGKYTFLQKAEIWIIAFEVGVMIVTGLVMWYIGVLASTSPNLVMLIVRDVHAIVAVTMLMGVTFHLFMTHVKEFPMDRSMFDGTVGIGQACREWQSWAREEIGASRVPCEERTHSSVLTTGMIVTVLLFAIIWTGVILQYVLSPLPTGPSLSQHIAPNALPGGTLGLVYFLGLNLAALVCIGSVVAIGYGIYSRYGRTQPA
ncbi:formate dehydrogenase subunit gamma [Halapricum hydrolyticum]|uniref:Cytochrome b/b6 domain-containing protein n=1 Tax=Halapricum hydrolyticum TaxID=2979991 RepID=A0AAE3LFE0_9EURY|nr:cytochrome b/b6 domain-containing protein [Halapricum hydrolyticum]MCU4718277.1 cytochrome b/b6 domain-containing protein [Halapricum hydrolyticum]MCU4727275.1 cytochrome b/b6 domain-containing protein [Halapricum hydrolyticum]